MVPEYEPGRVQRPVWPRAGSIRSPPVKAPLVYSGVVLYRTQPAATVFLQGNYAEGRIAAAVVDQAVGGGGVTVREGPKGSSRGRLMSVRRSRLSGLILPWRGGGGRCGCGSRRCATPGRPRGRREGSRRCAPRRQGQGRTWLGVPIKWACGNLLEIYFYISGMCKIRTTYYYYLYN